MEQILLLEGILSATPMQGPGGSTSYSRNKRLLMVILEVVVATEGVMSRWGHGLGEPAMRQLFFVYAVFTYRQGG